MWISLFIGFWLLVSSHSIPVLIKCNNTECNALSLVEELLPGTVVQTYTFMDPDAQTLTFGIVLQGTNLMPVKYLSLNTRKTACDVVISSRIDHEDFVQNGRELYFTIHAIGNQTTAYTVYVNVVDIDDNYPVFSTSPVYCSMPELDVTATCPNLIISDADRINRILNMTIISSSTGPVSPFTVTNTPPQYISNRYVANYTISLNSPLNYRTMKQAEIIVQAVDSANHTTWNSIYITVIDVPNSPPVFQNLPYIVVISESLPQNTYVTTVTAIDGDTGINSPIFYSLNSSSFNQYFNINSTTGIITIASPILRTYPEVQSVFGVIPLYVIASKNGSIGVNATQTTVTVQIVDLNISPAVFTQKVYNTSVLENSPLGTTVYIKPPIIISDKDFGLNAQYSISALQNGIVSSSFGVFPTSGLNTVILTVFVINSTYLNYELTPFINLTIAATQTAPTVNIPQTNYATVTVSVLNVNEFAPMFINTLFSFSVLENSAMYTQVGTLYAIDNDTGIYGVISYLLVDPTNKFAINATTGNIFVNVHAVNDNTLLDYERQRTYHLFAQAIDGGGLTSFTSVTINLINVNDNPPVFQFLTYYGRVPENSLYLNPSPFLVKATDADTNAIYSYMLVNITNDAQALLSSFSINNNTGQLTIISPISRDSMNQSNGNILSILVQVLDLNRTSFFDYCIVQIYIEDVNNNAPILNSSIYSRSISQNIANDMTILYLYAADNDQANTSNSQVSFKLIGNDASFFVINLLGRTKNGASASITKQSDTILQVKTYNFTVKADDCGNPPLSSTSTVLITVLVFNSHPPVFNQKLYQFVIDENVPLGSLIGQVNAIDADINNNLSYSLLPVQINAWNYTGSPIASLYNFSGFFGVNSTSGVITSLVQLDREFVAKIEILVLVVDNAAQTTNQTATATVHITITDLNDNQPVFTAPVYYLSMLEDFSVLNTLTTGATGLFTTCTDVDSIGAITYNYSQVNPSFNGNSTTGAIFLTAALDREKVSSINFTVWCNDGIHWSSSIVIVTVLDVNDNAPTFSGFISNFYISLNSPVGSQLTTFGATDLDIGEHARLAFKLTGGDTIHFAMSPNGTLTLAQSLQLVTTASLVTFVEVYDDPSGPYHLRTGGQVNIFVNISNSAPVFDTPSYQYVIPENVVIGFKLDKIVAKDNGIGQNGVFDYFFIVPSVNPNPVSLSLFSMTVSAGAATIYVNSSLKYKAGQYIIIIQAVDHAIPPLHNNCTLYINVTAINYYAPNFTNPVAPLATQLIPSFSITENVFGVIANISAFDPDQGVNGAVRYSLGSMDLDNSNFSIDPISGTLKNVATFVRMTKGLYTCRIKAYDLGTPSLSTYITIQVIVLDSGSKPPMFVGSNKDIVLSINEGPHTMSNIKDTNMKGFVIGNVSHAVNNNLGVYSLICYYMMSNINGLYLVPYTGMLYGLQFFDRETISYYRTGIKAVHVTQCNSSSPYVNKVYVASDSSEAILTLQIIDINDNSPFFNQSLIISRMPIGYIPGSNVIDFSKYSEDVDLVSQGQLRYSIQDSVFLSSPLNTQMQNANTTQYFTLDSKSGILSIGSSVAILSSMKGYFQMTVTVNDGQFTNTTSFMTYLVSDDQRVVAVVQDYLQNVANSVNQMATYFSQQLKISIFVDQLKLCTDFYQTIIPRCTRVYLYGFNTSSNIVINGNILLNMFGSIPSIIANNNNLFKISNILPVSKNFSNYLDGTSYQHANTYRLILIIIACICFLSIMVTCAGIYVLRTNYHRKIKAYTTSSSDHTAVLKSRSIPGTNLYENSKNPFSGSDTFDMYDSMKKIESMKRYGVPAFGTGLTLEKSTFSNKKSDDESQIIDSTETVF